MGFNLTNTLGSYRSPTLPHTCTLTLLCTCTSWNHPPHTSAPQIYAQGMPTTSIPHIHTIDSCSEVSRIGEGSQRGKGRERTPPGTLVFTQLPEAQAHSPTPVHHSRGLGASYPGREVATPTHVVPWGPVMLDWSRDWFFSTRCC